MRGHLLDPDALVRAVGSGRQKGQQPRWKRVELRYVDLKAGRHLQVTAYDETQAHTSNHLAGDAGAGRRRRPARRAVRQLARRDHHPDPPGAGDQAARGGRAHHASGRPRSRSTATTTATRTGCCRRTTRCWWRSGSPTRTAGSSRAGRRSTARSRSSCGCSTPALTDAIERGHLRRPTDEDPLRVVDLGCGNAYLTFAAHRFLTARARAARPPRPASTSKEQSREHNSGVAAELGIDAEFVVGSIAGARARPAPEVVLALHACDTATDEALARAVEWEAPLVLAAPCCHHDIAAQLRRNPTPAPYAMLTRHGILRERFADTLTDALRASLLRLQGYRVDVMQFVESKHTPRNTMLRAVRTGAPVKGGGVRKEYDELVTTLGGPAPARRAAGADLGA